VRDYRPEPLTVRRKALEKLVKGQTLILPAVKVKQPKYREEERGFYKP
jgi:ATP-dependent DNA ligase